MPCPTSRRRRWRTSGTGRHAEDMISMAPRNEAKRSHAATTRSRARTPSASPRKRKTGETRKQLRKASNSPPPSARRRRHARRPGPHRHARGGAEQHVRTEAAATHRTRAEADDGDEAVEARHCPGPTPRAPRPRHRGRDVRRADSDSHRTGHAVHAPVCPLPCVGGRSRTSPTRVGPRARRIPACEPGSPNPRASRLLKDPTLDIGQISGQHDHANPFCLSRGPGARR
jgi:hypothetical protein